MNRKAIMGIGTLIIFIATILVAAVAAGVIISTSGVLQQKALLIGEQSRNRLINGIQITHVFMEGNVTNKTANNIEILARPEPASGPVNFKTTSLSFFTDTGAYSAELSHREMIEVDITLSADPVTTTYVDIPDLDGDFIGEEIRYVDLGANDAIQINFSELGESDQVLMGFDVDSGGQNITIQDLAIAVNNTVGAYFHYEDESTPGGSLAVDTVRLTDEIFGECTFDKLRPETSYCIVTLTGTDDTSLEYGETVFIYYKLSEPNTLEENDEFELKIFPQDGRSTYIFDRVPQVIYKVRMGVYP